MLYQDVWHGYCLDLPAGWRAKTVADAMILAGDGQGEAILVWPLARGQESPEQMATRVAQVLAGPDRSFQIWIKSGDSQEANAAANLERPGGALERSQRSRWR